MNIAILGAGAMGSLFGGLLAEAGEAVTLIDIDAAHLDAIRSQGLRLESDQGDRRIKTLRTCRPDQAIEPPDLLIVFTKTLHSKAALEGIRAAMSERTHVLSLQNGLGNLEVLQSFVPIERILIGVTTWPADLVGPGHVRSHGMGVIRMMSADGVERPLTAQVVAVLAASGLRCDADANVWAAIWEKVAFNAALNSLCAVSECSVGELASVEDGVELALAIVDEVLQVARASGIDVDADKCRANVLDAIDRHTEHKPSMLQDILAGRRTEVESINGAIAVKAQALGIAAPHTRTLLGLVRLKEQHAVRRRYAATKTS